MFSELIAALEFTTTKSPWPFKPPSSSYGLQRTPPPTGIPHNQNKLGRTSYFRILSRQTKNQCLDSIRKTRTAFRASAFCSYSNWKMYQNSIPVAVQNPDTHQGERAIREC